MELPRFPGKIALPLNFDETAGTIIQLWDSRLSPDTEQLEELREQIEEDCILEALVETRAFIGKYSSVLPPELNINIVEGNLGVGEVSGEQIEIQLPVQREAIEIIQEALKPIYGPVSDEVANTLALAVTASTTLHEGTHLLIDSKPSSYMAAQLKLLTGKQDNVGETATMIDEGIAYAIQSKYATAVEPIGDLAPKVRVDEPQVIKKRKRLGERLKPKVDEYMNGGKEMDEKFLTFALQVIEELEEE